MYRCNACGEIFDELGCKAVEEDRGEYWGIPCSETVYYECCPHCGEEDDFEEGNLYLLEGTWAVCDEYDQRGRFSEEIFAGDEYEAEEMLYEMLQQAHGNPDAEVGYTLDYIGEA